MQAAGPNCIQMLCEEFHSSLRRGIDKIGAETPTWSKNDRSFDHPPAEMRTRCEMRDARSSQE